MLEKSGILELKTDEDELASSDSINKVTFDDFITWLSDLVTFVKPDLIVAIARGAIRLLQLHGVYDSYLSIDIISDNALPFLPDNEIANKRVLIFDDSLIFGSTMSSVREYLIDRKAITFCSAFVIDKRNFFGESKSPTDDIRPSQYSNLPIEYKHIFWPADIRIHHDTLVRRLLDTPNHYNLDFPTLQLFIKPLQYNNIMLILKLINNAFKTSKLIDISSPDSVINGIYRFTILLPTPSNSVFKTDKITFRPFTKVRLTISLKNHEIRLTPILQLYMHDSFCCDELPFNSDLLNNYWTRLIKPSSQDKFIKQSVFRLITSLITTIYLKEINGFLLTQFQATFKDIEVNFLDNDVKSSVGHQNSASLSTIYTEHSKQEIFNSNLHFDLQYICQPPEQDQMFLIGKIESFWNEKPHLKPHQSELTYEILGKTFLSLRQVTDTPLIRAKTPSTERINVGLSFSSIFYLIKTICGISLCEDDISVGIDICVDNGQAVPKILKSSSLWCRLFYSGERSDSIDPLQLKHYYHRAYSDYLGTKKSKHLTPFDLHKLTVTLKDTFAWMPFTTKYYIYGRYALPSQIESELIPWLTSGPNAPYILSKNQLGSAILQINPTYRFSPQTAWLRDKVRDVLDSFQYIATIFSKLTKDHKLLISTCKTHRHTYNAIAYEAHAWSYKGRFNFSNIATIELLNETLIRKSSEDIINNIYWCIQYVTEAHKKYNIFHSKFNKLTKRIASAFKSIGNPHLRFWQLMLLPKISSDKDPEISDRFNKLMPIISQMQAITSYFVQFLLEHSLISQSQLERKFQLEGLPLNSADYNWVFNHDLNSVASTYNRMIEQRLVPGLSIIKSKLHEEILGEESTLTPQQLNTQLRNVFSCYNELRQTLCIYCAEYDVIEGDFPYSPLGNYRKFTDGTIETIFNNAYILTLDIIGSTDSPQTNEFKLSIQLILSGFNNPNLYYEKTGNDAFIICADEPNVLFDIAQAIKMEGKRLMSPGTCFGGSRKGFSFGPIKIIQYTDNSIAIMDAIIPNIIPASFSFLSGIDSNFTGDIRNSLIIIQETATDKFKQIFQTYKPQKDIQVSSKHFFGKCSVINVDDTI